MTPLCVACLHVYCPCHVLSICTCLPGHYSGRSTYKSFARARGPSSAQCEWVYKHQNTYDVHKPRRPRTCMRHAHGILITHTLDMYVMPSVIGGGYHCMCGNTLTIPHAPSLIFFIPTPTLPRRTDRMFALRSSSDHSKVQTNNCIPSAHFGFACACGTGVSVVHQACAPGLQTGTCGTGLVDARVSHTCARHRLCAPGLQTCACGTGLADGGVTHALLDVAFSLSHSISISFSLARFLSLSHARSFSLSLSPSLSLSLIHTQTCWVRSY